MPPESSVQHMIQTAGEVWGKPGCGGHRREEETSGDPPPSQVSDVRAPACLSLGGDPPDPATPQSGWGKDTFPRRDC